ncbi:ArnT family glycosyltransferase [Chondromyces apiculatus]|uniref:Glycosyltransferase RgtA/B/C/D-like domain-containing protein n=1 Tax=Chondromyces apiculatus DSM 436 TaxID=1192034 RepID=A0A017T9U5_9BACT|nr:glycosyltransferase family 39 protein [Chondromyces apiculatus]EYF05570.1 Hypothetical protein CAP_3118 [Chondromyces apiculatus DSM 436]
MSDPPRRSDPEEDHPAPGADAPGEPRPDAERAGAPGEPQHLAESEASHLAESEASPLTESEASHLAESAAPPLTESAAPPPGEPRLIPLGNPLRWRGLAPLGVGSLLTFCIMALKPQLAWGVPVGALGIAIATFGILDLLGTFDDPDHRVAARRPLKSLLGPLAVLAASVTVLVLLLRASVAGHLAPGFQAGPHRSSALLIPAAFLAVVVAAYRLAARLGIFDTAPGDTPAADPTGSSANARADARGAPRPLLRRHGFWLVVAVTVLYLPMLGSHSLSDPWETHYGEVAREILARNDWISLWWAQDGWFWSKPVLIFWIQALGMSTLGVRFQPGAMLSAAAEGRDPWPEWAVRFPIFLLTLVATYLLYKAVARIWGRRAGLLGALALTTMPQWFLVSHQTMTDMPFVATMSAAMALFLLGIHTRDTDEVRLYQLDAGPLRLRLSAYHLVLGVIVACALPQILYLLSRNLEIRPSPLVFKIHGDVFSAGSPGNCMLPGNDACRASDPVIRGLQPALQALVWAQTLAILLYVSWGERRVQRLLFLAAWFFAALSTMAKGPAGAGLPVLCALVYVAVSGRYRDLLKMEIPAGLLLLASFALPWFVAMYARHGQPFTDRLLFHDMYKRAFTHVHDTNDGDDVSFRFYLWQLGYAMFPWTGLVPVALTRWLRLRERTADETKGLINATSSDDAETTQSDAAVFLAMWFFFAFALFSLMLTKFHHYILPALPPAAMLTGVLLDDALTRVKGRAADMDRVLLGAAAVGGAILVALVGRDLAMVREGQPSQGRLLHLFTYNYKRVWPATLDFSTALWVFTAAAAALTLLLAIARTRRVFVWALTGLAVAFTAWAIDVYFVRTSPHWGQRETMLAYVKANHEIQGPIAAYQMNWKGENFYTGNHIPAFVSSGKRFQEYVNGQKREGVKTFYFVTEHSRVNSLSNELGGPHLDRLTTPELNNKFLLVRAQFD